MQGNGNAVAAATGGQEGLLFARTSEGGNSLGELVRAAMFEDGLSQEQAAGEIGISGSALSQWLAGKYRGNRENIEAKISRWLDSRGDRQSVQTWVPDPPAYFATQTSRELITALLYAQSLGDMALLIGVPGVGKTTTCLEYQRKYSNVWLATMAAHTTGVVPVLREICDAVGATPGSGANGLARAISQKVAGRRGLLIVDEAHHLSLGALDAIRALHDATDVAIALVGSVEMTAKLERMAQLHSRLGVRLYRRRVLKGDVTALLDAWGIKGREERKLLTKLADRPGALRTLTKVLRLASAIAAELGEQLSAQHLADAAQTLGGRATQEAEHV